MGGWSVGLPRKADGNPQKQPARCAVWLWCVGEVRAGPVEGQGEEEPRGSEARRKAKSTPGRVAGAAVNHSSQRKGDCLGSRETAGCSKESWSFRCLRLLVSHAFLGSVQLIPPAK